MNAFLLFIAILSVIIDIASPLSVYGAQLIIFPLVCSLLYINSNAKAGYLSIICVFLIMSLIIISAFIHINISMHTEILIYQSIKVCLWLLSALLLYYASVSIPVFTIEKAVRVAIIVYMACLVFQVALYGLYGTVIDYSIMMGGEPSRNMMSGVGFRPTGLTSEPSVYCGITAWLITLRYAVNKKTDVLFILSCLSMLLTLSFVGVFLCFGILLIGMLRVRMIIPVIGFIFMGYLVLIDRVDERVSLFLSGGDGSNNVKIDTWNNFISNSDIYTYGYGLIGKSLSAPSFYESLYDMTIFGNLFTIFGMHLGVVALLAFIMFVVRINLSKRTKIMLMLSSLKISLPFFAVFYLSISLLCAIADNKTKS
ncbi:MAG TPA: hypothetical protein DFK21_04105 [Salmonella bongori]|uniref:O-antigen polymerase n=3 Tax=Salmonella bongori TaxID=54736 RepID=A0A248KBZ8_SALBN|nr:hypothetical protein [Salmonella bongori]ASG55625.1 hypothetical protein LFZ56_15920 [Salmonella bongori serovar 66:z41:- str. SA19983605]ECC9753038.1 hypothetical protein [Salmonella bongori]EDP8563825.1 hypothetical protein [Salmonella bongori]EDP8607647.1 hypothetical protein [Salmonella bongori]EDP8649145.1 hypothetical protein [Salmonella bongori]